MSLLAKLETIVQLKSSGDKFYDFYKNNFKDLLHVLPENLKSARTLEGKDAQVGCVQLWEYYLGTPLVIKMRLDAVDDQKKSITYSVVDGDLKKLYKSFLFKSEINGNTLKWTMEYEKANEEAPDADLYIAFATKIATALDAYLVNH
ncbi:Bet v I/Major latex protein [Dillenia turbinata]|uniref:Bet v I/Major latex protein n=1 Tax=Dillenia turbinata TaxID=194707 RepID=A0AAN8V5I3_9MAGN